MAKQTLLENGAFAKYEQMLPFPYNEFNSRLLQASEEESMEYKVNDSKELNIVSNVITS